MISRVSQLTPELETFYRRWLAETPPTCLPHFYNLTHQHQIVFLMKTPLERLIQPPGRSPVLPYVDACRKILIGWLTRTGDVWTQMARVLSQAVGGAKLTNIEELVENVYFTDCVKCESNDKDFKYHRDHAATAAYLREELALLKNAVLIISSGGPAWDKVRELMNGLSPIDWRYRHLRANEPRTGSNLMDVHGVLFEDRTRGRFVIPLTFPGGRPNALRNSYIEYLEEGLAAFAEMRTETRAPGATSTKLS